MNIQQIVSKAIANQMATLGGHAITIDSDTIQAIPAEVDTDQELMGGSRESREINYEFPTIKNLHLRKGMQVQAQDREWKIESFRRGEAMTSIRLIEPNRVE